MRQLEYRTTQVLSGHGSFGEHLHRIGRVRTAQCHHCPGEDRDSVQHTLEICPAWSKQRRVLRGNIGEDLALPSVVAAMLRSREKWRVGTSFCADVMARKEAAERGREMTEP